MNIRSHPNVWMNTKKTTSITMYVVGLKCTIYNKSCILHLFCREENRDLQNLENMPIVLGLGSRRTGIWAEIYLTSKSLILKIVHLSLLFIYQHCFLSHLIYLSNQNIVLGLDTVLQLQYLMSNKKGLLSTLPKLTVECKRSKYVGFSNFF